MAALYYSPRQGRVGSRRFWTAGEAGRRKVFTQGQEWPEGQTEGRGMGYSGGLNTYVKVTNRWAVLFGGDVSPV